MTVEIKKNRDDNTHMQYVNDIHKKEREVKNKISTDRKFRKKLVTFVNGMVTIQANIVLSKDLVVKGRETNIFLSQVETLNSKDDS